MGKKVWLPVSQYVPIKPGGQTHIKFGYDFWCPPFKHDPVRDKLLFSSINLILNRYFKYF